MCVCVCVCRTVRQRLSEVEQRSSLTDNKHIEMCVCVSAVLSE